MKNDNIKVSGHIGTWYVIATKPYFGSTLYLLEHETYGDETSGVIIDDKNNLILDDVWNGFLDYEESSIYEVSKVLDMVITQDEYEQVCEDWQAFSQDPASYTVVVASMVKYDIEERRLQNAKQCSSNTED